MKSRFIYRQDLRLEMLSGSALESITRLGPATVPESRWTARLASRSERSVLVILQAVNAGGKDGAIEALKESTGLPPIRVERLKRPVDATADHDLLRLAGSLLPHQGELVLFNRSYYEDLFHAAFHDRAADFERLRDRILGFERDLARSHTTLVKLHLHIDKAEQRRRLDARLHPPLQHLHNPWDRHDQETWPQLMTAFDRVLGDTHTGASPWFVIPANDRQLRNQALHEVLDAVIAADPSETGTSTG